MEAGALGNCRYCATGWFVPSPLKDLTNASKYSSAIFRRKPVSVCFCERKTKTKCIELFNGYSILEVCKVEEEQLLRIRFFILGFYPLFASPVIIFLFPG